MGNKEQSSREGRLITVRSKDGTEMTFRAVPDSAATIGDAIAIADSALDELREQFGDTGALAISTVDAAVPPEVVQAQQKDLERIASYVPPPTTNELLERIEQLERRVRELEQGR